MTEFLRFFKSIDAIRDGVVIPVLCWYELDGEKSILHFVVHPEGDDIQVDAAFRGPAGEVFEKFAVVDEQYIEHILDHAILPTLTILRAAGEKL